MKSVHIGKRALGVLSGVGRGMKFSMDRPAIKMAVSCGVRFIVALVLSGSEIFGGCRPFALAFVAASGADFTGFFSLLGAALGYTAFMGFYSGLRYSAAALLVFFVLYILGERPVSKRSFLPPLLAAATCLGMGLIYLVSDLGSPGLPHLISETILAGGCAYFYRLAVVGRGRGRGGPRDLRHTASLLILTATILIALEGMTLLANISVGRLLATLVVMASAYTGGMGTGSAVGTAMGLSMDVASAGVPFFTMAYAFSGLMSGIFRQQGRLSFMLTYILANSVAVLWTQTGGMHITVLYEVFVASVLFTLIPDNWLIEFGELTAIREGASLGKKPRELLKKRLDRLAAAFSELHDVLRRTGRGRNNDNDIASVFDCASEKVCRKCILVNLCWQKDYQTTLNTLNDVTAKLKSAGRTEAEDYPSYFSSRCLKLTDFLAAVNEEYAALLRRRQQYNRTRASREAVCGQYAEVAAVLRQAAAEMSEELSPDENAERRLNKYLKAEGVQAETSVYRDHTGRLRAELEGPNLEPLIDDLSSERFSQILRVPVGEPERQKSSDGQKVIITQAEPLAAIAGGASKNRDGKKASGDSGTYFKTDDGILYLLLTDGMGSGEGAERESGYTMRLLERFLKAGMPPVPALRTLNTALTLGDERIIAAVDMLSVDLFTGESGIYKYGGAPSYIKRGRTVRRLDGNALSAGSGVGSSEPDAMRVKLEPGDFAVILSDGVYDGLDDDWLRETIASYDGESPNELSKLLLDRAVEYGGAVDDMTILCLRIAKRDEEKREKPAGRLKASVSKN